MLLLFHVKFSGSLFNKDYKVYGFVKIFPLDVVPSMILMAFEWKTEAVNWFSKST